MSQRLTDENRIQLNEKIVKVKVQNPITQNEI